MTVSLDQLFTIATTADDCESNIVHAYGLLHDKSRQPSRENETKLIDIWTRNLDQLATLNHPLAMAVIKVTVCEDRPRSTDGALLCAMNTKLQAQANMKKKQYRLI